MTTTTYHPLYSAALDADSAYMRELKRVYGKNACNARYWPDSEYTDQALIAAAKAFKAATSAWVDLLAEYRNS